ncbi:MAG: hypothetical protein H6739_16790 [Alphaproteobacteria bacterium]|nr:hypothetical protein [Alphaproteobacteria bacterium]
MSVVGLIAALALAASPFPDPWLGSEGLDVVQVSSGEAVTLSDHLIPGRFTIFDFGAAWCAPCHDAAHTLKGYLAVHPDVAVRAISLEGDPWDTAALPAAQEHLPGRGRIPYFIVFDPSGQRIYQGHRVNRALRRVDRRRQRANQASSLSK